MTLLLVVMGLALLYAYRSQTPSVPEVDITRAIQDVNAGKIKTVTIIASNATAARASKVRDSRRVNASRRVQS